MGYEYLGEQPVKNIAKPVCAYKVLMEPRVTVKTPAQAKPKEGAGRRSMFIALVIVLLMGAGAEVLVDHRRLSVVGLAEVAGHLKVLYRAWLAITNHLRKALPDAVILIDFPDFNFLLARTAKRLGIKVFYYISPQVWAWRSGRVRTVKRLVDQMAVILPFESDFYAQYHMEVRFVGHPLLDVLATPPPLRRQEHGTGGRPLDP